MEKRSERVLLVVDSNILFSYFVFSKKIENIILSSNVVLYTPDWAIYELNKYFSDRIAKRVEKKGMSKEELELIVLDVMQRLIVVPKALYIDKWEEAVRIAGQFDEKDTPFIALAIKMGIPIWTGDKKMIIYGLKSGKYLALDTQAVKELVRGKSLEDVLKDLKKRYLTSHNK